MAVSKRLRFEILRRDNHTCRYCGAHAPAAALRVDHVLPEALGGETVASNLVTACEPCNSGKSSIAPDQQLVDDINQDALRWARAWSVATEQALAEKGRRDDFVRSFLDVWEKFDPSLHNLPADFDGMVTYWHRIGVPVEIVTEAVFIAMGKNHVPLNATFRYAIGIVRNQITDLEARARALVDAEEAPDGA